MVGRPGRSRGCMTCRRRKIKCDEGRPTCQKCRSSGFECEGYKDLSFISYGTGNKHTTPAAPLQQQHRSLVFVTEQILDFNQAPSDSSSSPSHSSNASEWDGELLVIPRQVSPSPLDETLLFAHLNAVFTKFRGMPGGVIWPGLNAAEHGGWNCWTCVVALASSIFGRKNGVHAAIDQGADLYGLSLRRLNKQLTSTMTTAKSSPKGKSRAPQVILDDDALLSAMVLGVYELFSSTNMGGWASHYRGLGQMMRIRGPEAHVAPLPHRVFQASRFLVAVAALADRKATFLAEPAWKTLPWQLSSKDPNQRLLDCVVDTPELLEAMDALVPGDLDAESVLYDRAMDVLDDMTAWRAAWDSVPGSGPISVPNESTDAEQVALFPTVFIYPSLDAANCMSIYNGALTLVYEVLTRVSPDMLHENADFPDAVAGSGIFEAGARGAALEICRSIPYQLASDQGLAGPLFVFWPLRQAWMALGGSESPEGRWLEKILRSMSNSSGWGVGRSSLMLTKAPSSMFRA